MSQADSFIRVLGVAANAPCPSHPAAPCCKCFLCLNSAKKLHGNLKWLLSVSEDEERTAGYPPAGLICYVTAVMISFTFILVTLSPSLVGGL